MKRPGIWAAIWLVLGVLTLPAIPFTAFLFDAPGSEKNAILVMAARAIVALPICFLVGGVLNWIFSGRFARLLLLLAPIDAVVVAVLFQRLEAVCGGQFVCPGG